MTWEPGGRMVVIVMMTRPIRNEDTIYIATTNNVAIPSHAARTIFRT